MEWGLLSLIVLICLSQDFFAGGNTATVETTGNSVLTIVSSNE